MNPTSLPFEYPFQWDNESLREGAGVTPEGAAILKQRDRDLEDYLSTLGLPWVIVAAANAPDRWKDAAGEYVCVGANDDAMVQAAVTAAGTDTVLLSPGTFNFDGPVVNLANKSILGAGWWNTYVNVAGITAFTLNNGSIEGVQFNQTSAGAKGVFARADCLVRACWFSDLDTAVMAGPTSIVESCFFSYFGVGVDVDGREVTVTSCTFDADSRADNTALKSINATYGLTVTGCQFRDFTSSGAYAGQVFKLDSCRDFNIADNGFTDCADYAVLRASATTGGQFANNNIDRPFLIDLSGTDSLSVLNNTCPVQAGTCTIRTSTASLPIIRGNLLGGTTSTLTIGVSTSKAVVSDNYLHPGAGGYTDSGTGTMKPTNSNYSNGGLW